MITSLGEERANLSAFRTFVRFVLVLICRFSHLLSVWERLRIVIAALPGLFSYLFLFSLDCPNMCLLKYDGSKTLLGNSVLCYEGHSISNALICNSLMNAYISLNFYQFVPLACVQLACAISLNCDKTKFSLAFALYNQT